jgi:hypothetical protein
MPMPRDKSTVDPDGPLAGAIHTLEHLGCREEAAEVKRLLVEWLQMREQLASVQEALAKRQTSG